MTGIIRRTDRLGRVCLPRGMRRLLAIEEDTPLEILLDSGRMVLKKFAPGCSGCASPEVYRSVGGVRLCHSCCESLAAGGGWAMMALVVGTVVGFGAGWWMRVWQGGRERKLIVVSRVR
ncbi:MAG: AbrB/MazE/SpoVT family DNA-binding domain-containing protein [Negativicutes bacterium]|nr:AbrB/MazE/SpoVT family DNA-binding domain-containing protein [Negativicutes bacterium]